MKLTEKSSEVLNYVRDNGGKVSVPELVEALGRNARSIGANVTDLSKKELAVREKEDVENTKRKREFVMEPNCCYPSCFINELLRKIL